MNHCFAMYKSCINDIKEDVKWTLLLLWSHKKVSTLTYCTCTAVTGAVFATVYTVYNCTCTLCEVAYYQIHIQARLKFQLTFYKRSFLHINFGSPRQVLVYFNFNLVGRRLTCTCTSALSHQANENEKLPNRKISKPKTTGWQYTLFYFKPISKRSGGRKVDT